MVSGFIGVYGVVNQYESTIPETRLFISDSNTEFPVYESTPYNVTSGTAYVDSLFEWNQIRTYPNYLGNNTWGISPPATPTPPATATGTRHEIVMTIPLTESWYIDIINVSIHMPTLPANTQIYTIIDGVVDVRTATSGWFNYTFDLSAYQSLQLYNVITGTPDYNFYLLLSVQSPQGNTLPAHAYIFNVEMTGNLITTWSLQNSINVVMSVSIGINIFVGVYMMDSVDFNVKRKDLKRRVSSYTKRKKSKGKR